MKAPSNNNHPVKKYPAIGACGLDCGLCPAFHRDGKSRCPGCCGEGFWEAHPGCGFITCCVKQKGLDTCGECNEFEFCPRVIKQLKQASHADSILSYQTIAANFEYVRKNGIKKWDARQQQKIALLKTLLENYNDGRNKSFFCLSTQLIPMDKLKAALATAQEIMTPYMTLKEKTKIVKGEFSGAAQKCGVELKLRQGK